MPSSLSPVAQRPGRCRIGPILQRGDDRGNGEIVILGLQRHFTLVVGLGLEWSLVDLSLVLDHGSVLCLRFYYGNSSCPYDRSHGGRLRQILVIRNINEEIAKYCL